MLYTGKTPGTKGAHDPKMVKNDDNLRHFARQNPCHSSRKQGKCIVVTPGAMWQRKKKKKLHARKGTRVSSFLEGTATSFPGPVPHDRQR